MPQQSPRHRAVVIGGGLGGLAAAVELGGRGADVVLVEANDHLGGKMNVLEADGFRFDMGPTILTLPEVLCGILRRAGRRVGDLVDLVRLDPQWRCHYESGAVLDLHQDVERMAAHLDARLPGAGADWRRFVAFSRRMDRLTRRVFFYRDVGGIGDVIRGTPAADPQVGGDALAMRLHSTFGDTVERTIRDPHVRQLAEHFLQYVGSSPFLAPAILAMIAAAQVDAGCWYTMGGTRSVARALGRVAADTGVRLLTGARAREIQHRAGRVTGVRLADGRELPADSVVSNCDVRRTLRDLVGTPAALAAERRIASRWEPACSGVVLYLGLDRRYPHLLHHNFLFSRHSRREFDDLYRARRAPADPTLYVAAPSRTDPDQAPAGGEALYVLVHTRPVPPGSLPGDDAQFLRDYRPVVIEKLKRFGMPDLERHIVVERALTPHGIEQLYAAEDGAIYGLASHGRLRGGFKPRNRSDVLEGLYFAGGSVNPGPGVPMVLMSGVTAADAIARDYGLAVADLAGTSGAPRAGEWREAGAPAPADECLTA